MGLEIPHIWRLTPLLFLLTGTALEAQVVDNFEVRFQTQQNGGIQFLANTTMHCGFENSCAEAQEAMPFDGSQEDDNNNDHDMQYFDGDSNPDTWCSSSDSLALGVCAEISFAGLYWAGRLGNSDVPYESLRDRVKISSSDDSAYTDVLAESETEFDASGVDNYCCFADITEWMQEQSVNTRITVANVVADEDDSSWGGWVLIIVYEDALDPMRNLTVWV